MKTLATIILIGISLTCYSQNQVHEYLTMTQTLGEIKLSKSSDTFEVIEVKDEITKRNDYDFRPILNRIEEFEKEGWEMVLNTVFTAGTSYQPQNYVLMRRKK